MKPNILDLKLPKIEFALAANGRVDEIYHLSSLSDSIDAVNNYPESSDDAREKLFIASAFLSDFLLYRSQQPHENNITPVQSLFEVTDIALDFIRGINASFTPELPDSDIVYGREFDSWSVAAFEHTDINKLKAGLKIIADQTDKMIHCMPMANGALPVSLLSWGVLSADHENMHLHPILFSRTKMEHSSPQISKAEVEYLKECVKSGDLFVIFDEDTESGGTMLNMMNYLVTEAGADFKQICGLTTSYSVKGRHALLAKGVEGLEATAL